AFVDAWTDACKADTKIATVIAPRVRSFLLRPLMFLGPCNPQIMHFMTGNESVGGINHVDIDGQGIRWLDQSCGYHPDQNVIAFTYRRNGELVNCKFRSITSRRFWQISATSMSICVCNLNADSRSKEKLVEGEIDKLSMEQAVIPNCVSVPDGAPY
nr:toprim domain, Twinkle-like protein [Tanacetum cinerariifolium]